MTYKVGASALPQSDRVVANIVSIVDLRQICRNSDPAKKYLTRKSESMFLKDLLQVGHL